MNLRARQKADTRRAILGALAAEIIERGLFGLSMQRVADRAGVTHRTLYNHFPTREALNDAFAVHVEELLGEIGPPPDHAVAARDLPRVARGFAPLAGEHAAYLRAYAMMTLATGAPAQVFRDRSKRFEQVIEADAGPMAPGVARLATAAIRIFISTAGWHLLTQHHGLSDDEAGIVSEWAVRLLLQAIKKGKGPKLEEKDDG